ncbi:tyrosine-type recombinase/integrase, partial [Escherichia coli]|uniref:tyrosine-type recombinase/integrase n=1 Tax=Escherichia coli TaxID=562 RepID=UPI003D1A9657
MLTHRGKHRAQTFSVYLLAYRHGMRISELLDLHYQDLDLNEGRINIRRLK